MPELESLYSANANNMKKSVIRELLKLTTQPGIISFAGGLPDPQTFPVEGLRAAADRVFTGRPSEALQYGTTEGDNELKDQLIAFEARQGVKLGRDNMLVVSASQQALDITCKVFLDPGDTVIAGRPTYLGEIQAIQSYRAEVLGIPFGPEEDGFDMGELRMRYAKAIAAGKRIKYIYVIADFQNPTGICWSMEKRRDLLAFSYEHDLLIVEDAPYREIRFLGEALPSIYQLDKEGENRGNVIGFKTFSKILAPGTRMGWIIAAPEIISKFVVAKQAMDLCSNVFTQAWIAEYLKTGAIYAHIEETRELYRAKRNHMVAAFEKYMPRRPDLKWTKPEGGLFLWISLPEFIDTEKMFVAAIEKKVAYVVGSAFYFDEPKRNAMRINFSYGSLEQIDEGVKRLSKVIEDEIRRHEGE
ncbi:MAG: PLP-dependent aminotransferase family protein [Rectinemataceae bacterium]